MTTTETTTKPVDAIVALGLTLRAEFVPWSQSRNKGEKDRTLNWRVTLLRTVKVPKTIPRDTYDPEREAPIMSRSIVAGEFVDRTTEVLTTDYSAGIAHCPSYDTSTFRGQVTVDGKTALEWETENGTKWRDGLRGAPILPDTLDVVNSLILDSDVLNYPTFEEWAGDLGYDPDSRKGEAIYRACLEIALKLRNVIGEDGMTQLREAFQDY